MTRYNGYCYDENGKFTKMINFGERPIYEKQTFYKEEQKEVVTEEKLCELHQSIEDGTYVPKQENAEDPMPKEECPDCVMASIEYETVQVPYEEDVVVGFEPDIPENCTLEVVPWLAYDPVFDKEAGVWVKTKEPEPTPEPKPEPTEVELLKAELESTQAVVAELLMEKSLREGL